MFADRAKIFIRSGKGGDGHVSFRRELYVPNGGPDGGDGGDGGDVIFVVDPGLNTLTDFRHVRKYKAEDGEEGGKRNCHGANGKDVILKVPAGTVVKDFETGKVILDMSNKTEPVTLLKGGRGGKGNKQYVTAVMQAPKYAQPGKPAKELWVTLELKMIADVGLVGFPNVGKSTFLSRVTNAKPKIADYHFTTLTPNLGVVDLGEKNGFVIADIPGIIEGASEGVGLGIEFLRHIERTKVLIHIVDAASTEGRDPIVDIEAINKELTAYNEQLASRPQVIAANKCDALSPEDYETVITLMREEYEPKGIKVFPISAVSGQGLKELLWYVNDLVKTAPDEIIEFLPEMDLNTMDDPDLPFEVTKSPDREHVFIVEGPRIERMLGYTNLESEKGFAFFQQFLKDNGILDMLEELGIEEGDTVKLYGLEFDYYK
ncbi:MAG: GTPase ObgE [Clostridium sp.]|nr:GTPase ObgE [Clostridium sp.]MCM1398750.1 GTPase ObgE [Clostridium sp.]MCM1458618.1 GTPase ObgE [Bacteroides sp.]